VNGTAGFEYLKTVLPVPLCCQHENHWRWRTLFNYVVLACLLAAATSGILVWNLVSADSGAAIIGVVVLALLPWVGIFIVWELLQIRVVSLTDCDFTVKGVCRPFIEALEDVRRGSSTPTLAGRFTEVPTRVDVRLSLAEATRGDVPMVCMRCGAPAIVLRTKTFISAGKLKNTLLVPIVVITWSFGGELITKILLENRVKVRMPFCAMHRSYWRRRSQIAWGGFCLAALLIASGIVIAVACQPADPLRDFIGWAILAGIGLAFVWSFVSSIIGDLSIRAIDINHNSICLDRIDPQFIAELALYRNEKIAHPFCQRNPVS
jgi:hypothetical protein